MKKLTTDNVSFGFRIGLKPRKEYKLEKELFNKRGALLVPSIQTARKVANHINKKLDLIHHPEHTMRAGELHAIAVMAEIFRYIFALYIEEHNDKLLNEALTFLQQDLQAKQVDQTFISYLRFFPTQSVFEGASAPGQLLVKGKDELPSKAHLLVDICMTWLADVNPAFKSYKQFFSLDEINQSTHLPHIISHLRSFFSKQEKYGPQHQDLITMLRTPAIVVPNSITGQLRYIIENWGFLLGDLLPHLLTSLDFLSEEEKMRFISKGDAPVLHFNDLLPDEERFSPDKDWMPKVVLLAKNAYVWLDQLSKSYKRFITTLDQVPDEELDRLADWGFTGLWLIGLWERSKASQRIKQLCGNPDAEASAYSLYDYQIAASLGGNNAYNILREKAKRRGIRMAGDMVPNHTGLDSKWVHEHPDWFVALEHSPFPTYSFNGENLSYSHNCHIQIEDHYFSREDAAVVFKHHDHGSNKTRYIYHGNDGTSMPWNDTAQLNYLNPEVRESVIQTILHVARMFPIIRFDAAMTLTKKHYQRLWFPPPGQGGDIPSRAGNGLSNEDFHKAFPQEFWREVVDRVAKEVPDTLLLAEAFWLMEGYFVRTLGMHRVYNSAFMNMLKTEDNAGYRTTIKNTLEFDPQILKRFVNFMNNPDEDTAIDQFGKGDKYLGVCTLMATLPGLPMFGHGQIEGFTEKYGMEYRKAYYDEIADPHLIAMHERHIFPLLKMRHVFADVENFYLYDLFTPSGHVDECVIAYSNRHDQQRALIVYNNRYGDTRGHIKMTCAFSGKDKQLQQSHVGEALSLDNATNIFYIFRDHAHQLEYIKPAHEIHHQGLYVELHAYDLHVFMDFRAVPAEDKYIQVYNELAGQGTTSIEEKSREIQLRPVHSAFWEAINHGWTKYLFQSVAENSVIEASLQEELQKKCLAWEQAIWDYKQDYSWKLPQSVINKFLAQLHTCLHFEEIFKSSPTLPTLPILKRTKARLLEKNATWNILCAYLLMQLEHPTYDSYAYINLWKLLPTLSSILQEVDDTRSLGLLFIYLDEYETIDPLQEEKEYAHNLCRQLSSNAYLQDILGLNVYDETLWFNHESLLLMLSGWELLQVLTYTERYQKKPKKLIGILEHLQKVLTTIIEAESKSDYQVDKLLKSLDAR